MTDKETAAFAEQYGGYWDGEHPEYTLSDWKYAVQSNDTRLGYWHWVKLSIEEETE